MYIYAYKQTHEMVEEREGTCSGDSQGTCKELQGQQRICTGTQSMPNQEKQTKGPKGDASDPGL